MSRFEPRPIHCPHCRHEQILDVASSINVTNHPRYRDQILAGEFQGFTCTECNQGFLVDDPLMYIDFTRKVWIAQFPADYEVQWRDFENEPREAYDKYITGPYSSPIAQSLHGNFYIRTVFGLNALAEKILCELHGLDDAQLGLVKWQLMTTQPGFVFSPRHRPWLISVKETELLFAVQGESDFFSLPADSLRATEVPANEQALSELRSSPYTDVGKWMIEPR